MCQCIYDSVEYESIDISATIYIEYKTEPGRIYQTIRIAPNRGGNIRYFTHARYKIGRFVEDFLQDIYIGDGENIVFESEEKFRNTFTIEYRVENENYFINLKNRSFLIEGKKPKFDGCEACQHLRRVKQGRDYCSFYKKFLDKYKKSCVDFLEKD